ncbi:MAG TPA: hydroxymethylbilane synthase [Opitutales bacterium]|nr:hydroxymethylbilane synthase [Opitutales bacterium]
MPIAAEDILVLATRRSPLARRQAEMARAALAALPNAPWKKVQLLELTTTGDKQRDWVLSAQGGKGLFTRELEEALLEGRAQLAVHSAKDLPTTLPVGLDFAGFLPRADPRDVLVRRAEVKTPKRIATGSPRRREQSRAWWPEVEWTELRGNVDTRLKKIAQGEADATFLAAAGLERLGITSWDGLVFEPQPVERMVPAAGQGAIALECRAADAGKFTGAMCLATARAVLIERAVLGALGGGCHAASAAHVAGDTLRVFHAPKGRANFTIKEKAAAKAIAAAVADVQRWLSAG